MTSAIEVMCGERAGVTDESTRWSNVEDDDMRALITLLMLLAAIPARAALAIPASVEGLARSSQAVVRGRVVKMTSRWSDDQRRIFSYVEVVVSSAWRGAPGSRVMIIVPGGVVGPYGQRVDGAPSFAKGEETVVFLSEAEEGGFRVTGLAQGKFRVDQAAAVPDVSHTSFVEAPLRVGERRAEPMDVSELERRVRSVP